MSHGPAATRRITANLPVALVEEACNLAGKGITETLVEGLELVKKRRSARAIIAMRGKLHLDIDLAESRGRARR